MAYYNAEQAVKLTPHRGDDPCVCGFIHPCCQYLVDGGCPHQMPGDHKHAPGAG